MRLATVGASFSSDIIIGLGTFVWLPVATCAMAIYLSSVFMVRSTFQRDLLPLVEYTARQRILHGNSIEIKIDEGGEHPLIQGIKVDSILARKSTKVGEMKRCVVKNGAPRREIRKGRVRRTKTPHTNLRSKRPARDVPCKVGLVESSILL